MLAGMKTARVRLQSISPYSQSKHYTDPPRKEKESAADYEKRTWRMRMHADENDIVFIPPMAFKNSCATASAFLGEKIPGRGKATYTKHFVSGLLVVDGLSLGVKRDDVSGQWLFLPSDGRKGGSSRVDKCFGVIHHWEGEVVYHILDEVITKDVFTQHVKEAGQFIGVGFFRPERGGYWGRYKSELISWE